MATAPAEPQKVRDVASEFEGKTDDQIQTFLDIAICEINVDHFGDKGDIAHAYLTAHLMKMDARRGNSGQLKRQRVGKVEKEWEHGSGDVDDLSLTYYGKRFKRLMRICGAGLPRCTGC